MLQPGDDAPDFSLRDADDRTWKLSDLRGKKVVIYFYPADDTPGCTAQACDFRDSRSAFADAGYEVFGVSPQGARSHQRFASKYDLNFPLLIDEDTSVARAYGAYKNVGEFEGIPLKINRSTFVIDENGKVVVADYGAKARGHVDKLKETLSLAG